VVYYFGILATEIAVMGLFGVNVKNNME